MNMFRLIISIIFIFFYSCQGNKSGDKIQEVIIQQNDSIKLFTANEKDSAYFIRYQFNKQVYQSGAIAYTYNSDDARKFIFICDTASKKYGLIANEKDTTLLSCEGERIYTVNGADYKILKLILDKGVTDGEVSYFFSIDFGILISRSNTWRIGKILNPEKSNNEYLQMTALLYKVLTEDDFLKTPIPSSKIKFTPPKVE
jgi:hypothetical protein